MRDPVIGFHNWRLGSPNWTLVHWGAKESCRHSLPVIRRLRTKGTNGTTLVWGWRQGSSLVSPWCDSLLKSPGAKMEAVSRLTPSPKSSLALTGFFLLFIFCPGHLSIHPSICPSVHLNMSVFIFKHLSKLHSYVYPLYVRLWIRWSWTTFMALIGLWRYNSLIGHVWVFHSLPWQAWWDNCVICLPRLS